MIQKSLARHSYVFFIAPALIWIAIFTIYPFFNSFYISLTDMSMLKMGKQSFVGLENFVSLWQDKKFWNSCLLSLQFTFVVVAGQFIFGFLLAMLFKSNRPLTWLGRTSIMLPWIIPPVALGLTWRWILRGGKLGLLNAILMNFHIAPKDWLGEALALESLMFVTIWIGVPFTFLLQMAGLQKIPKGLYEAASIDGAGGMGKLFHVTLPLMKSTFLINLIMITIGTIGYFDVIYALTGGGPNNATEVLPLFMYHSAFKYHQLGRGAAMAVFMLVLSLILTVVYLGIFRKGEQE